MHEITKRAWYQNAERTLWTALEAGISGAVLYLDSLGTINIVITGNVALDTIIVAAAVAASVSFLKNILVSMSGKNDSTSLLTTMDITEPANTVEYR